MKQSRCGSGTYQQGIGLGGTPRPTRKQSYCMTIYKEKCFTPTSVIGWHVQFENNQEFLIMRVNFYLGDIRPVARTFFMVGGGGGEGVTSEKMEPPGFLFN